MVADASNRAKRWEEATRDVAPQLQDRTCIVIVGERDDDAANVAIALAHAHDNRRVAIVDAVGELAPLQKLLPDDARSHGVIDHFLHGVSLRKIAYPVNREGTLFLLPSGVGPFDYGTLLRRERWRRLTMAFRAEGALLCIVLPSDAEGLAGFVEDTDGIVLVGDVEYSEARHIIGRVPNLNRISADAGVAAATTPRPGLLARVTRQAPSRRVAALAAGVAALVAAGALYAWARGDDPVTSGPTTGTAAATLASEQQRTGAVAIGADSADAAVFSVDIVMLNSLAAAGRQLTTLGAIPAATFSPVRLGADSARWYRLLVGAWKEQRQADSALMALRAAGVLEMGLGAVRRTPFAVRIAEDLPSTVAMTRATELRAQGFPAYALERDPGHASVYAGAFESPSQATTLLDMFKRAGIDATVAYRIGRGL
ncbi:MAG TPA: hypothetical protein VJ650_03945 [Gemmatimonadaceae bacterium]|nr:hypothetical protein [Gemmatimonadaceae bacterium]